MAESEIEVVIHLAQNFVKAFNIGLGDPQEVVFFGFRRSGIRPAQNTCKALPCVEKGKLHISAWETSNLSLLCLQSTAKSLNSWIPFGEVCK